jgi:molecular chaperone GrpE
MAVVTKIRSAGDKFGLKKFAEKGEKFDPEIHNALVQTPSKEVTEPTINEVIEAGFMIDDRLIRPAMVSVFVPEQE